MLWRGTGIDRDRRGELAAAVCCAALGALAVWLLVRLVWILVPRGEPGIASANVHVGAGGTASATATAISSWHLFGHTPPRPGSEPDAPVTTLGLVLRGTLADRDPGVGVAVIDDGQRGERVFRTGEDVVPGVVLERVYADRIVLRHDGREETLKLPRERNLAPADIVRAPPPARAKVIATSTARAAAAMNRAAAGQSGQAPPGWRATLDELRAHPEEIAQKVQVVPVLEGGRLSGVRVSAGGDTALIRQLGLMPGDVVTAVNGTPVDSLAHGQAFVDALRTASSARVTVLRNGRPTDVTISLK